jgi:hypothetical protein
VGDGTVMVQAHATLGFVTNRMRPAEQVEITHVACHKSTPNSGAAVQMCAKAELAHILHTSPNSQQCLALRSSSL